MADLTAHYGTSADVEAIAGIANVLTYSDQEGAGVRNDVVLQRAMDEADHEIGSHARANGVAVPVPTDDDDFMLLNIAFAHMVAWLLYKNRGMRDETQTGTKARAWREEADNKITLFMIRQRQKNSPNAFAAAC